MAFFALHPDLVYLKEKEILDQWNFMMPQAQGRKEKLYETAERQVRATGIPEVVVERKEVDAFREGQKIKKLDTQIFLCVHAPGVFGSVRHFIGGRDYGNNLLVSRYLILPNRTAERLALNVFEREDLMAFNGLVHEALVEAVKEMMSEAHLDFSKMDTKSKGIVDIV